METQSGSMSGVTPLIPKQERADRVRRAAGWSMVVVAGLLTAVAGRIGYDAATDTCNSCAAFGWFITGIVGLGAVVGWVIAVALFRTTGWVMYVVAGAFAVLAGIGLFDLLRG